MNLLRLRFHDRTEDIPLKSFGELTIAEWEDVTKKQEKGETKADVLYRMFGIPHEYGKAAHNGDALGMMKVYEDLIGENNRTLEMMGKVREACDASEKRELHVLNSVWQQFRPAIQFVHAHGQTFRVPQNIGTDVNYGQWMNLQVAIDQRAHPPDPEVEGDKGKPGTTTLQFYADVLACMLTNTEDPEARTRPARDAFRAKFEAEVDPEGILEPAERARRAEHARQAHYKRMALKSAKARRERKAAAGD